ncbi:PsbP-related protein [Clostridium sp. Mt-5]|uniref:PsbP-related protein n=1 Tax=Clostridium moutaii TaxID=3240932 RepID=A0ABV4BNL8_9CLOT
MKVILINKRKLGVTIIIIGLMIILFGLEKNFDMKLKFTALMQNDIKSLTQYSGLKNRLKYKLPSNWICRNQDIFGDEIVYHSDFKSADSKINGFVQVWNLKGDLKVFLQNSKSISEEQNLYKDYNIRRININGSDGYLVEYTITKEIGDSYRGIEYFLEKGKQFCRFSFFVKDTDFKENMPTIFETIVKTLEYK